MTLTIERPPAQTPVDDGTRREFIAGGLTLAALLAGCGDDGSDAGGDDASSHALRDDRGKLVGVKSKPTRVVCVNNGEDLQNMLAVGLQPIAYSLNFLPPVVWSKPLPPKGVPSTTTADGINFEQIATLDPQLIVSSYYDDKSYARLERIAPLYVLPYPASWRQRVSDMGRVLWRGPEAGASLKAANAAIAAGREQLAEYRGQRICAIGSAGEDGINVFSSVSGFGQILPALGFAPLPKPKKDESFIELSAEQVGRLEGDRLLVADYTYDSGAAPFRETKAFLSSQLGRTIPARKGGTDYLSTKGTHAGNLITALSIPYLVRELVTALA